MDSVIAWLRGTDWIANAVGIFLPMAGFCAWLWRKAHRASGVPETFLQLAKATIQLPVSLTALKAVAQVAIVDDNLADFPVQDLRKAGFQISTYRHVTVADFDDLAKFDVVFLDMHDIVKDDPTEGGLKLIRVLRQKNPRQKICAVSGNQFNPSATAFFKLADDTLNKPMSAQRCVEVLDAFLAEKLDADLLTKLLDRTAAITEDQRSATIAAMAAAAAKKRILESSNIPTAWPSEIQTAVTDLSRILAA